ncbi:hypothetical protein BGW39_010530 [Mortierella sp. 14UC]|nr:hypothetical protein BGW39_010530 [Mortierella sp. 14UC]
MSEQLDSYKHYHYAEEQNYEDLHVEMEQASLLSLEGGTLITLFPSVINGIVDQAVPIADAFRHEINNLETRVLALPKMLFTRELHRVTSQLSMLKRTIVPTQMLVHSLRGKDERSPLSPLAQTYMGDVMDHCNTMVEDIDSMLSLCEKLINMTFNLIAYDTNESMRHLALVTIIFLPITFVAGVYGTNFQDFPELTHDIGYFWTICGIVFAVFALPPRTRMYIGLGVMAFATAGLYIGDAMEEKLDPARRPVKAAAPSSQDSGVSK